MSKVSKITEQAIAKPMTNKKEAFFVNDVIKNGKESMLEKENKSIFDESISIIDSKMKVFDERLVKMGKQEIEMNKKLKEFHSSLKNYSNQTIDAMAKIDKVCAGNFDSKLLMLERFVEAAKVLDEMEKRGVLTKIAKALHQ